MNVRLLPALLLFLLAVGPGAAHAHGGAMPAQTIEKGEQEEPIDYTKPPPDEPAAAVQPADALSQTPPGSPADQALWRKGNQVSDRIVGERKVANTILWRHRAANYAERLEALAKKDTPEGRRAKELLPVYTKAVALTASTLQRNWPVDPIRGCRYPNLHLETAMNLPDSPRNRAQLELVRINAQECVEKAETVVNLLAASDQALKAMELEFKTLLPTPMANKPPVSTPLDIPVREYPLPAAPAAPPAPAPAPKP